MGEVIEIDTAIEIKFHAAAGVGYQIEGRDSLTAPWETITDNIVGDGDMMHFLYSTRGYTNLYFRAKRR